MAEPIDPALARKLDAFTVPPLPGGFADAVLARAMALPPESVAPPLPRLRRPSRARWLRGGAAGFGIVAAGMISVAAAAAGWLGEPIREAVVKAPLIGAVIERVVPGPSPTETERRIASAPAATQAAEEPEASTQDASAAPVTGLPPRIEAMSPQERREWLAAHPVAAQRIERRRAFIEAHPQAAQRIAELRAERQAAREAGASPQEMRQLRREQLREVREDRRERLAAPPAVPQTGPVAARLAEPQGEPALAAPAAGDVEAVQASGVAAQAGPGPDIAQRRLERRERIQERRERRRQRAQQLRP